MLALLTAAVVAAGSSLECSLNGKLVALSCVCDVPWKGVACGKFDILPRKAGSVPAYGYSPNVTSWGGNIIANDAGGYDLWVSEMVNECGLITWTTNSRIVHASAKTLETTEPFVFMKEVLGTFAHNAAPVRAPKSYSPCPGCYFLFHIGTGVGGHPKQCGSNSAASARDIRAAAAKGVDSSSTDTDGAASTTSGLAHYSRTPEGPWTPLPSIPHSGCNNPAPAFARDGSALWVLCNSNTLFKSTDPRNATGWETVATLDLNESPWTQYGKLKPYIQVEDPYIWQDPNGNWHLLCHRYDYRDGWPVNPEQADPVLVSGHAFSVDGIHWNYSAGPQPFDPWVIFEDGSRQNFSTFERPHLVFDEAGVPTHTVHGASPVWNQYGDHHPCEVCPARPGTEHSCVVCKSSQFYSYTYTLTQELRAT